MTTYTRTLDGVTDFTDIWGNTLTWGSDSWIAWYDTNEPTAAGTLTASYDLTGSDWTIVAMQVWAENGDTITLRDLDAGTGREINYLRLGFDSDVDLISTAVRHIEGWGGALHDVVLGSEYTDSISLFADVNKLTIDTGGAGRIITGGRDTVIVGYGGAQSVETGGKNDKVTVRDDGGVQSIDTGNGSDRVVLNAGYAEHIELGRGNDALTLTNGAHVSKANSRDGDVSVITRGDSILFDVDLYGGSSKLKAFDESILENVRVSDGAFKIANHDGWIATILAFDADLDIDIGGATSAGDGTGSANSITTYNSIVDLHIGADTHVVDVLFGTATSGRHKVVADGAISSLIVGDNGVDLTLNSYAGSILLGEKRDTVKTGTGWVEFISTNDGNDLVKIGSGGAATVRTGDGADVVRTGSGYVELINTGDGNDTVTLGKGVVGHLRLGDGDDTVLVTAIDPDYGDILWGGAGDDTIDFSAMQMGVTIDLSANGWQAVGTPPFGFIQLGGFENVAGTSHADKFVGDGASNVLRGLGGGDKLIGGGASDRLFGNNGADVLKAGSGADTLFGGKGNDTLVGGSGADIFAFAAHAGADTVTDFEDGIDLLQIANHSGGYGTLDFADVKGDLEITHDGGTIVLVDMAGTVLGADDFDFV